MRYGLQIGLKFDTEGRPMKYPGNTVISDIGPDNPAWQIVGNVRDILISGQNAGNFIFMPDDSYHVTVIRGVNDRVRDKDFWPPSLDLSLPMEKVDDYFESKIAKIPSPGLVHMRFECLKTDENDVRLRLIPAGKEYAEKLSQYRDDVAGALGFKLPGHDSYTYHITVAYVLYIPEGQEERLLAGKVKEIDRYLSEQEDFILSEPHMAFYDNMMFFYPHRIER